MTMMGMPTPQEQHKKLQVLTGRWTGEETIHPSPWDPKGGTAVGRSEGRVDLDGFFVITDYVQERGGQVSYRGHGVFGYDAQQGCYTLNWFDSMGMGQWTPARGTWEGNTLTFRNQTPMGHSKYIYTFLDDKRHTFSIENSQDGKSWAKFMESTYTKK